MKYIILFFSFGFLSLNAQDIDSAYYFKMNDSILKTNGVHAFENIFLINKSIALKDSDCRRKIQQWSHPTIELQSDSLDYFFITYKYDLNVFGQFSFQSILAINKSTGKLHNVYYEPNSYIIFKNTKKKQWNENTFNLEQIISIIESRKEVKFKSKNIMESSVIIEGFCKDIFFTKNQYSNYKPYTISLVVSFKDKYKDDIEYASFGSSIYGDCTHNYYSLSTLNSFEFFEVNFIFETEFDFFRPNKRKRSKRLTDYDVARFHEIRLSFSDHKVISDGLFSTPSGVEH